MKCSQGVIVAFLCGVDLYRYQIDLKGSFDSDKLNVNLTKLFLKKSPIISLAFADYMS